MPLLECLPRCAPKGVNNLIHSLGTLLKFGGQTVPMLSTNPLDPYSIAKSLIFIIAVNSKIERPPRLTELLLAPTLLHHLWCLVSGVYANRAGGRTAA